MDNFVNDSVQFVISLGNNQSLNLTDIGDLFDEHKVIGIAYYSDFTTDHVGNFAPDLVDYARTEIISYIDSKYALAKLQLNLP